jgi:hypothetical protein
MPTVRTNGVNLAGLVYIVVVFAVLFLPALLHRPDSPPGESDGDSGGGGGGGGRPPDRPKGPRGGIPLPDAVPARARLRDHRPLRELLPSRQRRPAREPDPARSPGPRVPHRARPG